MIDSMPCSVVPSLGCTKKNSIPTMGYGYWHSHPMREKTSPRDVLSQNLRRLMESRPDLDTIKKIVLASGESLSNGKVGRIYAASHTTDIDALRDLARVFDLEPWQLLVENLNPEALPRLADALVLAEIFDAVQRKAEQARVKDQSRVPTHQVQKSSRKKLPRELTDSLDVSGIRKNANRQPGKVQKPRSARGPRRSA
jgi:hypothetical protein